MEMVNPTETLLVLTSDHSHVMTMGGQATPRGHPILGERLFDKTMFVSFYNHGTIHQKYYSINYQTRYNDKFSKKTI